jgi:hypothetical protein
MRGSHAPRSRGWRSNTPRPHRPRYLAARLIEASCGSPGETVQHACVHYHSFVTVPLRLVHLFWASSLWCAVGCGTDIRVPPDAVYPDDPSLGGSQNIFNRRCLGSCHTGPNPEANLSLDAGGAREQLVGVATTTFCLDGFRVVPGNPDESCLWILLSTDVMPYNRTPLSADQKQTIYDWIASGAPP